MSLDATFEPTCEELRVLGVRRTSANRPVVEFELRFGVRNTGRAACDQWAISGSLHNCPPQLVTLGLDGSAGKAGEIAVDPTIGPTQAFRRHLYFGVTVEPGVSRADFIHAILNVTCSFRAVGESFVGDERSVRLGDVTTLEWLYHDIEDALSRSTPKDSRAL